MSSVEWQVTGMLQRLDRPLVRALLIGPPIGVIVFLTIVWFTQMWGPGDSIVYLAGGERLNAGHEVYALQPGDRPIFIDPPYWTVPGILSPPIIAVIWRPLALLPPAFSVALWWVGGITACFATLALLLRRAPVATAAALWLLAVPFCVLMGSGNVDAYRLPATVAVWWFVSRGRDVPAGVIVGIMTAIKVTPITLVGWLFVIGRGRGVVAAGVTFVILLIVSIAGAGLDEHLKYLEVIRSTVAVGTAEVTLAGLGRALGVAPEIARWFPIIGAAILCAGVVAFRHRPGLSFSLAVIAAVAGTPATGFHTFGVLLAALAPRVFPMRQREPADGSPQSTVALEPGRAAA
jgi:glycosyl transferase family 87